MDGNESKILDVKTLKRSFDTTCAGSSVSSEWSLHQISPYIGKIKSSIARFLIRNFSSENDIIYDPFCGAGTIPLEANALSRNIFCNDLNRYAYVLTMAKLFPPISLESCIKQIELLEVEVHKIKIEIDLRKIPKWVREFFNNETLREVLAWVTILERHQNWFLLSCLLGILHHQRPGFLSYPSSHTVPYLRKRKFPQETYKELYEYREVKSRLTKKVERTFRRMPILLPNLDRLCLNKDASKIDFGTNTVDVIITSPPYMRQLDYARDNRLRLWFLGVQDIRELDKKISPKEADFISMIKVCLKLWKSNLKTNGKCILFLGDNYSKQYNLKLPEIIEKFALDDIGGFKLVFKHESVIPSKRRVRRKYQGNQMETIIVLQKTKD